MQSKEAVVDPFIDHPAASAFRVLRQHLTYHRLPLSYSDCKSRLTSSTASLILARKFDKNRLSVVLFMNSNQPDGARIQCRWTSPDGSPMYSSRGLHELRLTRSGSYLNLDEFNDDTKRVDPWLKLYFKYYESRWRRYISREPELTEKQR